MNKHKRIRPRLLILLWVWAILMFVVAIMMISRLRFPKATIRKSKFINAFQLVNIALIFYCGIFRTWPEYLFGIGVFLLIAGTIAGRITRDTAPDA